MMIQKQVLDQRKFISSIITNFKNMILKRSYRKSSTKGAKYPPLVKLSYLVYNASQ